MDDNEQEKVYEAVFSNDISSILEGGQYDPSVHLIRFNQIVPIELVFCLAAFLWYIFDVSVC